MRRILQNNWLYCKKSRLPFEFRRIRKMGSLSHWRLTRSTQKFALSEQYTESYSKPRDLARITTNLKVSSWTNGVKNYLTGSKIAKLPQTVAQTVHPHMTWEEISRFSLHLGRVWAVGLLDEAGMSPEFIKSRLRYLSNAYRLYLRNTSVI